MGIHVIPILETIKWTNHLNQSKNGLQGRIQDSHMCEKIMKNLKHRTHYSMNTFFVGIIIVVDNMEESKKLFQLLKLLGLMLVKI